MDESQCMLSVIVPVYNQIAYLERAINSILNQTYKNIEVIIIDDGSNDGSEELCLKFVDLDSRIKLIQKSNEGVSAARNDGLKIAKGKYITFVDPDDWLDSFTYYNAISYLDEMKADICVMDFKTPDKRKIMKANCSLSYIDAIETFFCNDRDYWSVWDKIYKKDILEKLWFDDEVAMGEDLLFNWHAFMRAKTIIYSPICGYHYEPNETSATHIFSYKHYSVVKAFSRVVQESKKMENIYSIIKYKYVLRLIDLLYAYFINHPCDIPKNKINDIQWFLRQNVSIIYKLNWKIKIKVLLVIMPYSLAEKINLVDRFIRLIK